MSEKRWPYFVLGVATIISISAVSLDDSGITFPDGTRQTTASASEVQNFFSAFALVSVVAPGETKYDDFLAAVPEGYRALVEYVSVSCSTPIGNRVTNAFLMTTKTIEFPSSYSTTPFQIPLQYQGQRSTTDRYVGGLMTRLYSDRQGLSSTGVTTGVERESGSGTTTCEFSINGRYLPIPAGELS